MTRVTALLLGLALTFTTACGSTVAQQGSVAGSALEPGASSLAVETGPGLEVPGDGTTGGTDASTTGMDPVVGGPDPSRTDSGSAVTTTGADPGSSSAGAGDSDGSGGNGPAVTDPIKVGLFSTDFAKAAAAISGGSDEGPNADRYWRQLIAAQNKRGGVAGRKVETVSYVQDGTSNNYPADFAAACEYFARDEKVDVVLHASIPDIDFASCLLRAGIATISVSQTGLDRARASRTLGLLQPSGITLDAAGVTIIEQMLAAGRLTSKDKVGVILSECPHVQQIYKNVIAPRLKQHNIAVDAFTANECIKGFSGVGSVGNGAQAAVLRFQRNGVTQVMPLLASLENLMTGLFSTAAENQGYRPGYLLSTAAFAQEIYQSGTVPDNQFKNMKGVGWIPAYDLYRPGVKLSSQGEACRKLGAEAGITPAVAVEQAALIGLCDPLFLLDAALERSGGATDARTFVAAARSITDYVSTQTLGQPGDLRAVDTTRFGQAFSVDASCMCVRYVGKPVRISA